MSAIDEGIVREYFEQSGFLVRQVRKYDLQARRKNIDEDIDLLVYNPTYKRGSRKPDFFLFSSELPFIHRAIISVVGWHSRQFTPGTLKSTPEIFRFLEENVIKEISRLFPADTDAATVTSPEGEETSEPPTKILVLPSLPTAEPFRSQSVQLLKERGVDAIISFRAMLIDIIDKVETNRNYRKSDTLQILRLLKNYDLIKDPQLEMFDRILPTPPRKK